MWSQGLGARGEDVRGGLEPARIIHAAGVDEDEQGPVVFSGEHGEPQSGQKHRCKK
jgi:hypothetical protein